MEDILVTVEGNKIVGTTKGGHVSFTIIPASTNNLLMAMSCEFERSNANMAAGLIMSGILYDDQECLEHAEEWMERLQSDFRTRAENHMVQCLDMDYETFTDCDEVNCTMLAEETAKYLDHDEWLDDPDHWIWDIAVDVADEYKSS